MKATVKLFAHFRDGRFQEQVMDLAPGTTVQDIAESLGIEWADVGVTMLDSRHCPGDQEVHDGATVALFPMIGGG